MYCKSWIITILATKRYSFHCTCHSSKELLMPLLQSPKITGTWMSSSWGKISLRKLILLLTNCMGRLVSWRRTLKFGWKVMILLDNQDRLILRMLWLLSLLLLSMFLNADLIMLLPWILQKILARYFFHNASCCKKAATYCCPKTSHTLTFGHAVKTTTNSYKPSTQTTDLRH